MITLGGAHTLFSPEWPRQARVDNRPWGGPSPGAKVSALRGSRQGFQDPLAGARSQHSRTFTRSGLPHGQSILEAAARLGP
jgi:hypothetical protein